MVNVGPVFNIGSDKILENLHQKDTKLVGFQVHFVNVVAQLTWSPTLCCLFQGCLILFLRNLLSAKKNLTPASFLPP